MRKCDLEFWLVITSDSLDDETDCFTESDRQYDSTMDSNEGSLKNRFAWIERSAYEAQFYHYPEERIEHFINEMLPEIGPYRMSMDEFLLDDPYDPPLS